MRNIALLPLLAVMAALSPGSSDASTGMQSTHPFGSGPASIQAHWSNGPIFGTPFFERSPTHRHGTLLTEFGSGKASRLKLLAGMDQSSADTVIKILGLIRDISKANAGKNGSSGDVDPSDEDDADDSSQASDSDTGTDGDEPETGPEESSESSFNGKAAEGLIDGLKMLIGNASDDGGEAASELQ